MRTLLQFIKEEMSTRQLNVAFQKDRRKLLEECGYNILNGGDYIYDVDVQFPKRSGHSTSDLLEYEIDNKISIYTGIREFANTIIAIGESSKNAKNKKSIRVFRALIGSDNLRFYRDYCDEFFGLDKIKPVFKFSSKGYTLESFKNSLENLIKEVKEKEKL